MNYRVPNIYGKIKNAKQRVNVPGSKSITARALLLATLAEGQSTLYGVQFSEDCATFLRAVQALGVSVAVEGTTVRVQGCGGRLPVTGGEVYVGSAGTAARFITAVLAFTPGEFTVACSPQMARRPVGPLVQALQALGAQFTFLEKENCFPFIIRGTARPKASVTVDISKSSQFLSALLMAATCAGKPVAVRTVGSHGMDYVRMTIDMMWSFGVTVQESEGEYVVGGRYAAKKYDVEPDVSAACYFYAANRVLGTDISVAGVLPHTMQGDYRFIELLRDFDGGRVDMSRCSDQALTLAAIAPYFKKPTAVCGIAHVRGQECDRIAAAVNNLRAMGVRAEEAEDGFTVYPGQPHAAVIDTYGDHRVAMAFALTGLRADGIVIENAEVCGKTFREYFETWDGLVEKLVK